MYCLIAFLALLSYSTFLADAAAVKRAGESGSGKTTRYWSDSPSSCSRLFSLTFEIGTAASLLAPGLSQASLALSRLVISKTSLSPTVPMPSLVAKEAHLLCAVISHHGQSMPIRPMVSPLLPPQTRHAASATNSPSRTLPSRAKL